MGLGGISEIISISRAELVGERPVDRQYNLCALCWGYPPLPSTRGTGTAMSYRDPQTFGIPVVRD